MLALLFPGQGSQSVGMMKALNDAYPEVKRYFDEASEIVKKDLWHIAQENPDDLINHTAYTQPILLSASYAGYQILNRELNLNAQFMAGHSLGEYSALCASQALNFAEAINLVYHRGTLMQSAVAYGEGAMAAILGLEDKTVIEICEDIDDVWPANFNAPGQIVIGGKTEAVQEAIKQSKASGAKRAIILPVSVPSHTPLMRRAAAEFSLYLDKIHWHAPKTTVIFNVDAKTHHDRYGIQAALGAQLYEPVQWSASIRHIAEQGVNKAIEIGAGKVLTGLVKRIDKNIQCINFESPEHLETVRKLLEEQ